MYCVNEKNSSIYYFVLYLLLKNLLFYLTLYVVWRNFLFSLIIIIILIVSVIFSEKKNDVNFREICSLFRLYLLSFNYPNEWLTTIMSLNSLSHKTFRLFILTLSPTYIIFIPFPIIFFLIFLPVVFPVNANRSNHLRDLCKIIFMRM